MADEIKAPVSAPEQPARKRLGKGEARVRVLKQGHGKIHTGKDTPEDEKFYNHGDEPTFPQAVADALEERGFVEIL